MPSYFPLLCESIKIGGKIAKNRIVALAMADFGMTGVDGFVNEQHLKYYGAFALGDKD